MRGTKGGIFFSNCAMTVVRFSARIVIMEQLGMSARSKVLLTSIADAKVGGKRAFACTNRKRVVSNDAVESFECIFVRHHWGGCGISKDAHICVGIVMPGVS